ncbi:TetR/AcrR family transcriptional regulator [Actinomadura opuntiae]|uniref:TetR/AcrR family transcriptional regulator n=1 Tax=Actinomadura sp. OS1-43 TaxID=604315 RepID=UPI00255A9B13|nr:TetR/AcrR family transcriptional regulator [Actinomadura sp. OS1-43]MDL4814851.1 TetR/AcrR family transcriptional regulator [Actinomadura sp. OS1-43]
MTSRRYGGATADQRRAGRRAALLDAALDLLGTGGLQAATLRAVCARAGLNPRYFYESFTDLDALLTEVYDRIAAETADAASRSVAEAGPDADLRATVRAAALAVLDIGRVDPRKARVALIEASASPVLRARRHATRRHYVDLVIGYARTFYDIPPSADAQLQFTATMLVAGWSENLIAWLEGDLRTTASGLADMFADAAQALAASHTGSSEHAPKECRGFHAGR